MQPVRVSEEFWPANYIDPGSTYMDLLRGMEEALRRWDEIDGMRALELVAYFHEAIDLQERHGVRVLTPSTPDVAAEHLAVMLAAVDIIKRADASGYDARGVVAQMRPHMRREIEYSIPRLRQEQQQRQRPTGLFGRLFGR
ncbi:MAG: hypothetical protein ABIQ65_01375 [Thermoanaerobaculia bacterium]